MAAPVYANRKSYTFRDAKGQTARLTVLIGDATAAAFATDGDTLRTHLAAMSNGNVAQSSSATKTHTLGTATTYLDVEDKAVLTFTDPNGNIHRYQVPCPKTATFQADQETVNAAETNTAAVIADFGTFVYGDQNDTAPLVYVGGVRYRTRFKRRFNIFTRNPLLTDEGE